MSSNNHPGIRMYIFWYPPQWSGFRYLHSQRPVVALAEVCAYISVLAVLKASALLGAFPRSVLELPRNRYLRRAGANCLALGSKPNLAAPALRVTIGCALLSLSRSFVIPA